MLLYNPTDDPLKWTAGVRPPLINGPEQMDYPPNVYVFEPGKVLDVPNEAAEVLLVHLGRRGLVPVELGADLAPARRQGRMAWYKYLEGIVRSHKALNVQQRHKGLRAIDPNEHTTHCYRTYKRLQTTEFADAIMDDPSIAPLSPEESAELAGDDLQLIRNATLALQRTEIESPRARRRQPPVEAP